MCCFAVDVVDDVGGTLDHIGELLGDGAGNGVLFAAAYHAARDLLPRNPRRLHFSPAGLAFPPDPARFPDALPPPPQLPVCGGRDVLAEVVAAAAARGMAAHAWVVYLHHDVAHATSAGRVRNAFGDENPIALCPADPAVQAYTAAMTAEVCERRPAGIFAEALHYPALVHGAHHERIPSWLGGLARVLLALCFCDSCTAAADADGVDVAALVSWVRRVVSIETGPLPARADLLARADAELPTGTLSRFLALREAHVERVVRSCADVATQAGVPFTIFDGTHALAEPHAAPDDDPPGWQVGVELGRLGSHAAIGSAFYCTGDAAFHVQLAQLRRAMGRAPDGALLHLVEDVAGFDRAAASRTLQSAGVAWLGCYHYGLAPEWALESIAALTGSGRR